nr:DUF5984 family protein [Saccharibacillus qingshengii]
MIRYKLKEWKDIVPWGDGQNQFLHWFGLTYSYYWFDFQGVEFPKYSKEIVSKWHEHPELGFIDYPFMRIFEDLCEGIRFVEDPVPDEVFQQVNSLKKLEAYIQSLKDWVAGSEEQNNDLFYEAYEVAREWLYGRSLDFGYLVDSPKCFLIRNGNELYVYWIAAYRDEQGIPFWDKPKAVFSCDYQEFMTSLIKSFKAFAADMRQQISDLFENKPEHVHIDREQILADQIHYEERITELENKRLFYADSPDWNSILKQIRAISRNRSE